jgi:hypothetical protein
MRKKTRGFAVALASAATIVGATPSARAKSDLHVPEIATEIGEALMRPRYGYFSVGTPRWFISTKSDLGTPYVKPFFSFGYGVPHWIWAGLDVNAIATPEFVQGYFGVRAASPILDLAFGLRDTQSFYKPFLAPAASYRRDDVLDAPGPAARYWAWEAEAVAIAPLPYSALLFDLVLVHTLDVPEDRYVYEESYRAVVKDASFAVLRAAAVARFLNENALKIGILTDYVFSTGRDPVVRLGPVAAIDITDHLEALGALTMPVRSPDALGAILGSYGLAGLRYRWASGEPAPKLPWQGLVIP